MAPGTSGKGGHGYLVDGFRERFDSLDRRMGALSARIDAVDQKVDRFRDELAARIDGLDQRINGRIDSLEQKVSRHFIWLVGIQMMVLLAVIGALISR